MSTLDDAPDGESPPPAEAALPMRRIAAIWAWLPAFRAVAETENLRRAATFLALSPPALSRTLKLLEDAVGHALFVRDGRRLHLTAEGRVLLLAVRRAMRSVDEALGAPSEALKLHVPPALAALLAPHLVDCAPQLALTTRAASLAALVHELQRGALDLVIVPIDALVDGPPSEQLTTLQLPAVPFVVLPAAGPPPTRAVALAPCDAWPVERARAVVVETDDLATALAAWRRGLALALPRALVPDDAPPAAPEDSYDVRYAALRRVPIAGAADRIGAVVARVAAGLTPRT